MSAKKTRWNASAHLRRYFGAPVIRNPILKMGARSRLDEIQDFEGQDPEPEMTEVMNFEVLKCPPKFNHVRA